MKEAVFPISVEYVNNSNRATRNYGVSLHGFAKGYLKKYPDCSRAICGELNRFLSDAIGVEAVTFAFDAILQEFFPQKTGKPVGELSSWIGEPWLDFDDYRVRYTREQCLKKILAREDRVLVCPVYFFPNRR